MGFAEVRLPRMGLIVERRGLGPILLLYFDSINANAKSECLQTDVCKKSGINNLKSLFVQITSFYTHPVPCTEAWSTDFNEGLLGKAGKLSCSREALRWH